jgi:hypothetical protein
LRDGKLDKELIEHLIEIGALEFVYVDEDGESIYKFTKKAKELVPDIYNEHMKDFNNLIFSLWMKDIIDVIFDENGEPLVGVNNNTHDLEKTQGLELEEKEALKEIISSWNEMGEEWYNE